MPSLCCHGQMYFFKFILVNPFIEIPEVSCVYNFFVLYPQLHTFFTFKNNLCLRHLFLTLNFCVVAYDMIQNFTMYTVSRSVVCCTVCLSLVPACLSVSWKCFFLGQKYYVQATALPYLVTVHLLSLMCS